MKNLMKTFAALAIVAMAATFTACNKGGDDGQGGQITLPNQNDKEQDAWADDGASKGFTFTAKSAWTAAVKEGTGTRASNVSWVRLLLNGVETYSGAAGTFNMAIEIDLNTTGRERSATVTVKSGTDEISVTVTQKGTKEDLKPLTPTDLLIALPWKHVSTTTKDLDGPSSGETDVYDGDYDLTFASGKATATGPDMDVFTDFFGLTPPSYTFANNKLTFTGTEGGEPYTSVFDVTELTATALEFTITTTGEYDNGAGSSGTYNQKLTIKLKR